MTAKAEDYERRFKEQADKEETIRAAINQKEEA